MVKMLEAKARRFDNSVLDKCVFNRNYEALEMYVLELLMTDQQAHDLDFLIIKGVCPVT